MLTQEFRWIDGGLQEDMDMRLKSSQPRVRRFQGYLVAGAEQRTTLRVPKCFSCWAQRSNSVVLADNIRESEVYMHLHFLDSFW